MDPAEILRRPYARMVIPDEDGTFAAEIVEFPGCIAVGATAAEALSNLDEVAVDWISATLSQGQDIPEPMESAGYSGRLVLRMPKSLHKRATLYAERDGVSLNQFIVTCIAEKVGERARPAILQTYALRAVAIRSIRLAPAQEFAWQTRPEAQLTVHSHGQIPSLSVDFSPESAYAGD